MSSRKWTNREAYEALEKYLNSSEARDLSLVFGGKELSGPDQIVFLKDAARRAECGNPAAKDWWESLCRLVRNDQPRELVLVEILARYGLDVDALYHCLPDPFVPDALLEAAHQAVYQSGGQVQGSHARQIETGEILESLLDHNGLLKIAEADDQVRRWWQQIEEQSRDNPRIFLVLCRDIVKRGATLARFHQVLQQAGTTNLQAGLHYLDYLNLTDREDEVDPYWWTRPAYGMTKTGGWSPEQIRRKIETLKSDLQYENSDKSVRSWWDGLLKREEHRPARVLRLAEELVLRRATLSEYCQAMEESGDRGELATLAYLDYQRTAQAKGRRFSFRTATVDLKGKITATASGSAVQFFERLVSGVYLEIVSIPGGIFQMGAPETENGRSPDEGPVHPVSVKSFYLGKYPITQRQWQVVAGWPRQRIDLNPDPSRFKGPLRPVENVSWFEAVEFCERLSSRTGRQYRLPTEAEWEYACRAGTTTPFSFGATINPELVNYDGNNPYGEAPKGRYRQATVDVGQLGYANSFGLYDMHGNVWEWVEDVWHNSYEEAPRDGSAWLSGGNQEGRVLRGGSWVDYGFLCRSATRSNGTPDSRDDAFGFRVVMGERTP